MPKGLFTAGFLARLAYEKHVLGRPVHRIVQALAADGFDVAPGTLCGALKQVAALIAPWAEAIAAHGRTAGHVHADETSWQVFEDVDGKDGHRWWLWVFVTDATTVFVMDTSRSAQVAAGQLGIDREQAALEAGRRLVISSDFHKAYQSLALIYGVDPLWCLLISGSISCLPGPRTPRRSATGPTRVPSGSQCCTGRTTRSRPPHRAPTPTRTPPAAVSGPSPTSTRTAYSRPATPPRACCIWPPSFRGHAFWEPDDFEQVVEHAVGRGWRIGCHAVGDCAVRRVLDAYERVAARHPGLPPGTLVIEHAFLADAQTRARAVRLGVGITVQHPLLYSLGGNLVRYWGEDRASQVMPVRAWMDEGALIAAGSDCNVSFFDPLLSIWGLVTRGTRTVGVQGPESRVDTYTAIWLYTAAGGRLLREDDRVGTLASGAFADIVGFRGDLMDAPVDDLPSRRPALTVVGGRAVHDPDALFG